MLTVKPDPLRVLVADDEPMTLDVLAESLVSWGYDPVRARDGDEAWRLLQQRDRPVVAILDQNMPGMTGTEVCRLVRQADLRPAPYLIILTGVRIRREDSEASLRAGADDYLLKPFDADDLRSRIELGTRIVALELRHAEQSARYEGVLQQVRRIESALAICGGCHRIRDAQDRWQDLLQFLASDLDLRLVEATCPECRASRPGAPGGGAPTRP